jgi:hypothetical protein
VNNGRRFHEKHDNEHLNGRGSKSLKKHPSAYQTLPRLISLPTIRSSKMAARVAPPVYTTVGFWLIVIGILLIGLSSIGIEAPVVELFELGVGLCFASFLIR